MSNQNDFVNLNFFSNDKREALKNSLFLFVERQKNFNRLESLVSSECSRLCLSNFKSEKIDAKETICLTNCAKRFYDTIEIGENITRKLANREVDMTPFINGKFEDVISKL